jgi:hypothetical protein
MAEDPRGIMAKSDDELQSWALSGEPGSYVHEIGQTAMNMRCSLRMAEASKEMVAANRDLVQATERMLSANESLAAANRDLVCHEKDARCEREPCPADQEHSESHMGRSGDHAAHAGCTHLPYGFQRPMNSGGRNSPILMLGQNPARTIWGAVHDSFSRIPATTAEQEGMQVVRVAGVQATLRWPGRGSGRISWPSPKSTRGHSVGQSGRYRHRVVVVQGAERTKAGLRRKGHTVC